MPKSDFVTILSYLRPRHDLVSLLGGEPTLHSHFRDIVDISFSGGYRVKIFTNGTNARLREISASVPKDQLSVILNLNELHSYLPEEINEIQKNCRTFQEHLSLSFNIYSSDFTWDHIKDTIITYGINRSVRVGITQPIRGASNLFLSEKEIRRVYQRLVVMVEDLAGHGIHIGFDCGFRLCLFTPSERTVLAKCGTELLFVCSPILDIGPDLMVWRCFPFSTETCVKLTDFDTLININEYFNKQWEGIQKLGNTDSCECCKHRMNGVCGGGCLSRTLLIKGNDKLP
jgi:hypothetical protein